MNAIIFANAAVLDGTSRERREDHHVLVEGKHIREVSDRPIRSAAAETIDLEGRTLMPGLIDAHVHVLAVDAALARLPERPVTLLTLQAAKVLEGMLARGFTTVRDAGGADGGLAEAVEAGLVRGPRIFPSGMALSQTGGHGDTRPRTQSVVSCACCEGGATLTRIADGVTECRRAARDELRKGATQIKILASGGVASPYDPRSGTCNTARKRCAPLSRRRGPGTPMSWPTPTRPRQYVVRSISACARPAPQWVAERQNASPVLPNHITSLGVKLMTEVMSTHQPVISCVDDDPPNPDPSDSDPRTKG